MKKENEDPPEEAAVREPKRSKNEQMEAYLSQHYDFRFNTVKCKPDYKAIISFLKYKY